MLLLSIFVSLVVFLFQEYGKSSSILGVGLRFLHEIKYLSEKFDRTK